MKAIVTTTINLPIALKDYAADAALHGHRDLLFIVIGDRKTPDGAEEFCRSLEGEYGFEFEFWAVGSQIEYLSRYPELRDHLPFDSIQRRNIGLLRAYELGCDPIITIDDDNYASDGDFVGHHSISGGEQRLIGYSSSGGWLNVCKFLRDQNGQHFYHRGFPLGARDPDAEVIETKELVGRVVVNAGLWLEEPDVDAVTRLAHPIRVTSCVLKESFALTPGTWSPFDSQNTALARDVLPAYFLSPHIGRYDDIWASYVVNAIAHHLGHLITFGLPLVRQERNDHSLLADLDAERLGMGLTDRFTDELKSIELTAHSYGEGFLEIHDRLRGWLADAADLKAVEREFLTGFLEGMAVWVKTMERAQTESS